MTGDTSQEPAFPIPRIPGSAGALIFDAGGRLLILKPTYKKAWTIPGGQIEADGESPWDACKRETFEECGVKLEHVRLACVDFLHPKPGKPGGVRFLFDGGTVTDAEIAAIRLQPDEIKEYRFAELPVAAELLSGPLRRRVSQATAAERTLYLENGRPVSEVA